MIAGLALSSLRRAFVPSLSRWYVGVSDALKQRCLAVRLIVGRQHVPRAGREIVEANQVDVPTAAVVRGRQQLLHTAKARFAREVGVDVRLVDGRNRVDDDVPLVHGISSADLDVELFPDANAAPNPSAPHAVAKALAEHHAKRDSKPGVGGRCRTCASCTCYAIIATHAQVQAPRSCPARPGVRSAVVDGRTTDARPDLLHAALPGPGF